jgi:1,4-dihydroxy-2-naphthoate octaprenyltransferase
VASSESLDLQARPGKAAPGGIRLVVRILRAPFFTATIVPVCVGAAVAWAQGYFHLGYFALTLIGAVAIHAGLNVANDYFDHLSGNDEAHPHPTPFSGGSRVIQEGIVTARQMLAISVTAFVLGAAIGLFLAATRGWMVLWLGLAGAFFAVFNSAPPLKLSYRGHGLAELGVGLGCGPIPVLGAYFVQAQHLSLEALWASIPVAILIVAILYINEFPDYEADKAVNKQTPVVLLGRQRAVWIYAGLMAANYVAIVLEVWLNLIPPMALLAVITAPLAYRAVRRAIKFHSSIEELIPANAATINIHLATGIFLWLAYLIPWPII